MRIGRVFKITSIFQCAYSIFMVSKSQNNISANIVANIVGGNVASLRGIIRDELNTKLEEIKAELSNTLNTKIKTLTDETDRLSAENVSIKKVLQEHQKYLERARKGETKNTIFISGIPNVLLSDMTDIPNGDNDGDTTDDHVEIIHHILNFVNPGITKQEYKILVNFDAKENYSRHSAKIRIEDTDTKSKIFKVA